MHCNNLSSMRHAGASKTASCGNGRGSETREFARHTLEIGDKAQFVCLCDFQISRLGNAQWMVSPERDMERPTFRMSRELREI